MRCLPACTSCRLAGVCEREGEPFKGIEIKASRSSSYSPGEQVMIRMPCGCPALPVELVRKLGENFETFLCDLHGLMKVTKAWKKKVKTGFPAIIRIPSEYGYTTAIQEELP